jgi:hypothetical protein
VIVTRPQVAVVKQTADVEGFAVTRAAHLEQAAHRSCALDETIDLWQFELCQPSQALMCGAIVGAQQLAYLIEREADMLGGIDNRQPPENVRRVSPFP